MRTALILLLGAVPLFAIDAERDFSGSWILIESRSDLRAFGSEPEPFLTVEQDDQAIRCRTSVGDTEVSWQYLLNGTESPHTVGGERRNSVVKWEGAALLINTLVSGRENYTIMDRWRLSDERAVLTVTRQIVRANGESEGRLVYRRAGSRVVESRAEEPAPAPTRRPILQPRPVATPSTPVEAIVPAGSRVLLELVAPLHVSKSKDGDHVYLRTVVPVAAGNRIVIPSGSNVTGTITESKATRGKRDLYIRFDTLTLPDGETRDLRSRPEGGAEGKVGSQTDSGREARTVATGAGIGASIGSIAGAATGHTLAGLGIGGLAGAAAGLGSVLSKRKEITLPRGTNVEMVLDRDLRF